MPDAQSTPLRTPIRIQVVARSSPGSKKRLTGVPTRADGSQKYETSWNSAGASQTGRCASTDRSTFYLIRSAWRCRRTSRCRFTHDIKAYLAAKPRDIKLPSAKGITITPPFVVTDTNSESAPGSSLDFTTVCPSFEETGECRLGLKCRFLGAHARIDDNGTVIVTTDEEKKSRIALANTELNQVSAETLKLLRQNKVCASHSCFLISVNCGAVPEAHHRCIPQRNRRYETNGRPKRGYTTLRGTRDESDWQHFKPKRHS